MASGIGKGKIAASVAGLIFFLSLPAWGAERTVITFFGGTIGSVPYMVCGASAEILKKVLPGALIGVEPGGATLNAKAVEKGDAQIGITHIDTLYDAWNGRPPYDKPHRNLRILSSLQPQRFQLLATRKSGIQGVEDLAGKRYSPSLPGQASYTINEKILEVHGISFEEVKKKGGQIRPLAWNELIMNMTDGHIDASSWTTAAPAPGFTEISRAVDCRLISLKEEKIRLFLQKYPQFSAMAIPANVYKGQTQPVSTIGTHLAFVINAQMPDDLVHTIAKALWENRDHLVRTYSGLSYIAKDTVIKDVKLPVHPGALKFYREIGIPEAK